MKTLTKYLFETVDNIFEASFESQDYTKHNFKYPKLVISDLLNGQDIGLGTHNDSFAELDQDEVQEFRAEYSAKNFPKTPAEFNAMVSKYPSFPKWNKICKDKYSGFKTNTKGQRAEGLVCYMFNESNPDVEAFKKDVMNDLTDDWIQSSKWTVEYMNKQNGTAGISWTSDNYIACRVDGGDYKLSAGDQFAVEVTSIFSGIKAMEKVFGFKCGDLYKGQKDIWNKADIVLVHREMGKTLIEDLKAMGPTNGETLNTCLIEMTKKGAIIPISLKMLESPDAHLSSVNIVKGEPVNIVDTVKHVRLADSYSSQYTGNIEVVCNSVDGKEILITFRSDTNGKNGLSIEPKEKGGSARLGKAVAIIRGILNLNRKDFYVVKDTNEDAIKAIESYGFEVFFKPRSNYDTVDPPLRERACCAGLLGVLEAYHNKTKEPIDEEFPVKFANFCLFCAVGLSGSGAFYKISN